MKRLNREVQPFFFSHRIQYSQVPSQAKVVCVFWLCCVVVDVFCFLNSIDWNDC